MLKIEVFILLIILVLVEEVILLPEDFNFWSFVGPVTVLALVKT